MSIQKTVNKAVSACENCTDSIKGLYDYMKGLSLKCKSCFDLQLKSKKNVTPISRLGFSCDKEIKVLPVIYVLAAILLFTCMLCSCNKDCDK